MYRKADYKGHRLRPFRFKPVYSEYEKGGACKETLFGGPAHAVQVLYRYFDQ